MMTVTIDDVRAAAKRIEGRVRRTPLLPATLSHSLLPDNPALNLKLECLQVSGSFKARGAMSALTTLEDAAKARGLITASGGNHGLGVACAGHAAGVPVTIYLPGNTPSAKAAHPPRPGPAAPPPPQPEPPAPPFPPPPDLPAARSARIRAAGKVLVPVRKSRGRDTRAACGQLIVEGGPRQSPGQQAAQMVNG